MSRLTTTFLAALSFVLFSGQTGAPQHTADEEQAGEILLIDTIPVTELDQELRSDLEMIKHNRTKREYHKKLHETEIMTYKALIAMEKYKK